MTVTELLADAERLQEILINAIDESYQEWGTPDQNAQEYCTIRQRLRSDPRTRGSLPEMITNCRSPVQILDYLENEWPTYKKTVNYRRFVYEQLLPLFQHIEGLMDAGNPLLRSASDSLSTYEVDRIFDDWQKMMDRKGADPSGTITAARTLIESVCHHIVQESGGSSNEYDLDRLYKAAAKLLRLDANDHNEGVFKKILSGCYSVVSGLASLRNDLGDAHGQSALKARAGPRHAELAANMAATMATFMLDTWEQRKVTQTI